MSLAVAMQRVVSAVQTDVSTQRVDTKSKCTVPAVPRVVDQPQSRRQLLGVGFAAAAALAAAPATAKEGEGGLGNNRAIRFSGGIKDAQAKRAAREAEMREKLAALKEGAK